MNDSKIRTFTEGVLFEDEARRQVANIAAMPFIHQHVAIMPDVHAGIGATVGSVIPTIGAIIPAAVGVDIGCGMVAARLNLTASELPDTLAALRSDIEAAVPHGRTDNGGANDRGAWGEMRRWMVNLPDVDLAYLPEGSELFADYMGAVAFAQRYARTNRDLMLAATLRALQKHVPHATITDDAVNCHHNYVSHERHYGKDCLVTRKGAVSAKEGELGIIPGSMGTRSYIVRGKGNRESFSSCSHGAGRRMSRTRARAEITLEEHVRALEGVECRKDESVLDETPGGELRPFPAAPHDPRRGDGRRWFRARPRARARVRRSHRSWRPDVHVRSPRCGRICALHRAWVPAPF